MPPLARLWLTAGDFKPLPVHRVNYLPTFGGFGGLPRSKVSRAQSCPYRSTFAFKRLVPRKLMVSLKAVSGGAGGLPRGRFGAGSMRGVYVTHQRVAERSLLLDNKCLSTEGRTHVS